MNAESNNNRLRLTDLFNRFFSSSQTGGVLLLLCTIISLFIANSSGGTSYIDFWNTELPLSAGAVHLDHSVAEWINDGLMTLFFLLVGLEIKREFIEGELSNRKTAILPVIAAIGGMVFPALIYLAININSPQTISGAGIPTATDIAFAIAIMALLGDKVPNSLKVFLTALAIIDDLGAIVVIAVFYGTQFSLLYLFLAALIFGSLMLMNKLGIQSLWFYLPLGLALWYCMLHSGIHATLAGVLLAVSIPFRPKGPKGPSHILENVLQIPVNMIIIPLFALANTAIILNSEVIPQLAGAESLGIICGLFLGKPLGIFLAAKISHRFRWANIPHQISSVKLWGAGVLGGIGFTMAIFMTNLVFADKSYIELGKISILIASAISAITGYIILKISHRGN